MDMKFISGIVVAATLLYAGILTLQDNLYIGIGMMLIGSICSVLPIGRALGRFRRPLDQTGFPPRSKKTKRKTHLKVVDGKKEERPTYH
jgi:hypothetical protein